MSGTSWGSEFKNGEWISTPFEFEDLLEPPSPPEFHSGDDESSVGWSAEYRWLKPDSELHGVQRDSRRQLPLEDYHIGWICALQVDLVAATELLDEHFRAPSNIPTRDDNNYTFGRMGDHHLIIACLPKGNYGLTSATSVAIHMQRSFPNIHIGLMVGTAGGAPNTKHDIRLGDVVVSTPTHKGGGVIHYGFGRSIQHMPFMPMGSLNSPPVVLQGALQHLSALHERRGHNIASTVKQMSQKDPRLQAYGRPDPQTDVLYKTSFIHPDNSQDCIASCMTKTKQIQRQGNRNEDEDGPVIHYGLIGSADLLMRDARMRDHLADTEDLLCFEMEAAGLMDRFPCVVIRGISNYADTHKNDMWQKYAAATAAAYAKEFLGVVRSYNGRK